MIGIGRTTLWALVGALACGCGDDGDGGNGGGGGAATTTAATTAAVTTGGGVTTAASGGTGGEPGTGGGPGTGGSPGTGGAGGEGGTAPACATITLGDDIAPGGTLALGGSFTPDLGDPELPDRIDIGYEPEQDGFDLASVVNDNLATCEQCVVVLEDIGEDGVPARVYFQSAGLMDVDEDADDFPFAELTFTGVELIEVTLDEDGVSTPVEEGECLILADGSVEYLFPDAWTCEPTFFADAQGCDCRCGAVDPDCADPTQLVFGCGAPHLPADGPECTAEATCVAPDEWTCAAEAFGNGLVCDCLCGVPDPDCTPSGPNPALPVEGCDEGSICTAEGTCRAIPPDWTCTPVLYGDGGACDCGCGAYDPDCDDASAPVFGCAFADATCRDDGSCAPPSTWTCLDDAYDDGATCDCECGAVDPDCSDPDAPTPACAEGEICNGDACIVPIAGDVCDTALALAEGTTNGTWAGATGNYSPGSPGNSCTGYSANGLDVVYAVSLAAGQTITATLASASGDKSLYLVSDCGAPATSCVDGSDVPGSAPETIEHTSAAGGDFFLIADQFFTFQSAFTLEVTITP